MITLAAAAARYGVLKVTVWHLVWRGLLPATKLPRGSRFIYIVQEEDLVAIATARHWRERA